MDEIEDLASDTSDDDYVPGVESDDDIVSDCCEDSADEGIECTINRKKTTSSTSKRKKTGSAQSSRNKKRTGGIKLDDENKNEDDEINHLKSINDEKDDAGIPSNHNNDDDNKKRADDLWSSFKKDVETTTTPKPKSPENKTSSTLTARSTLNSSSLKESEPVTVTNVYKFAGEEVRVIEKIETGTKRPIKQIIVQPSVSPTPMVSSGCGAKKPTGIGNILNKLSGKKNISTLEKSRLDWNQFKHQEGIEDELHTFNKGKEGYLEKQAFLQRADIREYEIERSLRMTNKSNR